MIEKLNHVAIAVPDLDAAAEIYRNRLGAVLSEKTDQPEHGVQVVFVDLPGAKIELLGALGEGSPIAKFLEANPSGGLHHLCYEVEDVEAARDRAVSAGARALGEIKIGAHGKPVVFLHPKDCGGVLTEFEQR